MAAKKKKVAKKASKKTAKKASAPAKSAPRAKKKAAARLLGLEERQKLLKPRSDFEETIRRAVAEWSEHRSVKVPSLSPARLGSLLSKAERAEAKENAVRAKYERALAPLADARRIAHHDAFKALLDLYAGVKFHARSDPGLLERFAFLADALRTSSGGGGEEPGGGES